MGLRTFQKIFVYIAFLLSTQSPWQQKVFSQILKLFVASHEIYHRIFNFNSISSNVLYKIAQVLLISKV